MLLVVDRYRLLITVVKVAVCCTFLGVLGGCEIGRSLSNPDQPVVGIGIGSPDDAAIKGLFGTIGGLVAGPPGAIAGTGLATLAIGLWRGQRQGWDEHARERGAPASAATAVLGHLPQGATA